MPPTTIPRNRSRSAETIRLMPRGVKNDIVKPIPDIDPSIIEWLQKHSCIVASAKSEHGLKWTKLGKSVRKQFTTRAAQ